MAGGDRIDDFIRTQDVLAIDSAGFGIAGAGSLASQGVAFVQGSAGDEPQSDHDLQCGHEAGSLGRRWRGEWRGSAACHAHEHLEYER
jgi:hypothetical protein